MLESVWSPRRPSHLPPRLPSLRRELAERPTPAGPLFCPMAHADPPLGLPTILQSKLPSLMLCVPDSLPLTRSKLPSTVGSTSYHAEHKETRAFAISYACPSECIVPPCGLVLPPKGQSRPPPRPPPGLPANLPVPRSVPPASQWPTANPAGRDGQHDPAAAPSGAPRAWPSGSTTSLPFRSPLWLPNLMPLSGGGSGEAEHPRLLEQESLLGTLAEPPWRIPKSRSHWKSLQMHSYHPTLQIGLPRARALRRQASESPSASLLCSPDPGHLPLVTCGQHTPSAPQAPPPCYPAQPTHLKALHTVGIQYIIRE